MTRKRWQDNPNLMNREWVLQQLIAGKTNRQIADLCGYSPRTIQSVLAYYHLTRPFAVSRNSRLQIPKK